VKTALVILDMLNDFIDGTIANPAAKLIIDPIATLAEAASAKDDWMVIYANDAHQLGHPEGDPGLTGEMEPKRRK